MVLGLRQCAIKFVTAVTNFVAHCGLLGWRFAVCWDGNLGFVRMEYLLFVGMVFGIVAVWCEATHWPYISQHGQICGDMKYYY